jgi:hypothetical protein
MQTICSLAAAILAVVSSTGAADRLATTPTGSFWQASNVDYRLPRLPPLPRLPSLPRLPRLPR